MEKDFVEAPSQMLENWCWEREPLRKMSSHYIDKSEIPEDILNALLKSRNANVGYINLRQVILASYDQRIHSSPEVCYLVLFCYFMRILPHLHCMTHFL